MPAINKSIEPLNAAAALARLRGLKAAAQGGNKDQIDNKKTIAEIKKIRAETAILQVEGKKAQKQALAERYKYQLFSPLPPSNRVLNSMLLGLAKINPSEYGNTHVRRAERADLSQVSEDGNLYPIQFSIADYIVIETKGQPTQIVGWNYLKGIHFGSEIRDMVAIEVDREQAIVDVAKTRAETSLLSEQTDTQQSVRDLNKAKAADASADARQTNIFTDLIEKRVGNEVGEAGDFDFNRQRLDPNSPLNRDIDGILDGKSQ